MVQRTVAGLYAVTPEHLEEARLLRLAEQVLAGGARILQYRDKGSEAESRARCATSLARLCRTYGALFIVNDDVELTLRAGADGVHLGREDAAIAQARAALGADAIIGASCYADLERARAAAAAGADYLAFGSFFASQVKPNALRAPLAVLRQARRFGLPLVAIGGITADNAGELIAAGADAVAVVTALFGAADPAGAARNFARLFDQQLRSVPALQP